VKLQVTPEAKAKIRRENEKWRELYADAPTKFKDGLAITYGRILKAPRVRSPWGYNADGEAVWRIYSGVTMHHVFYTIDDEAETIFVEWVHGAQQRDPKRFTKM
jgi:hypothetical protein